MTSCPEDERLVQLLEEQLDRREQAEIERHLEACDHCQETLEELTRLRFSFIDWRPWADVSPSATDLSGSFDGLGSNLDRPPPRRLPSSGSSFVGHSPTQPSLLGTEPFSEGMPEVEGYEILEKLGHGGMGVVYRARQPGLDRLVALKMIRSGSHAAPEHLVRFRIEARAVARLRHPNVVQIYDVGQADGLPFVALELLEGGSLESRVAGTPQPERSTAELLVTLAGAIGAAHRAGVVHRDLKSANVLFAPDGTPKVADFGLAKRLDEEDGQTHSGQVMGSPSFMAPEQALGQGREVGPSADLYSLGAILYEMLTGRPPFKGASAMETLFQVVHDDPIPPSRLRPGLSRDLETICLKCLTKEPGRRYDSAESLADDLGRYLAGAPVRARRTGLQERAWKWARRQPAAAALAAFAMASLVALSLAGFRSLREAKAHANRVEALRVEGTVVLARAVALIQKEDWKSGRETIRPFLRKIGDEPLLAAVRTEAEALLNKLDAEADSQQRRAKALERFERFQRNRHRSEIGDTQFTGVGQAIGTEETRRAARAALDEFKAEGAGEDWRPGPLPSALSPEQRAEVTRGQYELLLIRAEAICRQIEGEDPRHQAELALGLLDRAGSLHGPTSTYHLLRSSCLARMGDGPGADRERKAAEAIPTTDALDHVLKGRELSRRQNRTAAIAEFEDALRLEPGLFRAHLLMAVCQLQAFRPDQAKANLTACLQREPRAISLYLLRGFAYGEEGYRRQRMAREVNPRLASLESEAEAQFEAAEADFRSAQGLKPDSDERYCLLVNRGALRFRRHRLDEAVADLSEAIGLKPDQVAAYVQLGQTYRRQGRTDEAIEQFTRGIRLRPEMAALYRSRALARLDRSRPSPEVRDEALRDLSEAIRLERAGSPDSAADHARRARLLLIAGHHQEALADCEDALRSVPDDPEALTLRVKALLELKRYNEVVEACDDALAKSKPSADLFELRGVARSGRQEYSGAIQDFTQAMTLDPARPAPLIHRGWAYLVSDAPKLALHDFDEAIRIAPDEADAYNGRGFARVLHGQHRAAVADAEESLRRRTPDARTTYNAARIYAKAAVVVTTEGPRRNLAQLQVAEDYQDRAQALIRRAIELLPDDQRGTFWRDVVQTDPALAALRQRPKFSHLAGQFERLAK